MNNLTVLGIGNLLMKDDGIGVYVVERLSKQNNPENIKFVTGETDIGYCLSIIDEANHIVIIDAVVNKKQPGEITVLPLHKFAGSYEGISLHNQSLLVHIVYK